MTDSIRSYSTFSQISSDTTIGQSIIGGVGIVPPMIIDYYGIPNSTGANTKVGIISLGGGFQQNDLQLTFNDLYASGNLSTNVAPTITTVLVNGATNNWTGNIQTADTENTLDIYCISTVVPQANIVIYIAPPTISSFADAIQHAVNDNCDVISVSWGTSESSYATSLLEPVLANAAAKGITVLVASGDHGSYDGFGSKAPEYPASSANVIAVGGTYAINANGKILKEYAAQDSGGGISSIIPVPSWQTGLTAKPYFHANGAVGTASVITGRGVPDIAAPFWYYALYFNNNLCYASGTSAACPVMAGVIARYISLNNGRRPVTGASTLNSGFYKNASAFFSSSFNQVWSTFTNTLVNNDDVNTGINGYVAVANAWDPITGLGRPYGQKTYQIATSNGTRVKTSANNWNYIANVQVKTDTNTWTAVQAIWTKTATGWRQTY
jgi:subtilase family serine protease